MPYIIAAGAIIAMFAVILGAMGAHALQSILSPKALTTFHTAAEYQMTHGIALILAGLAYSSAKRPQLLKWAARLFLFGVLLFSGSLYILSLSGVKAWGMVTPIGGMAFILAWLLFALGFILRPKSSQL